MNKIFITFLAGAFFFSSFLQQRAWADSFYKTLQLSGGQSATARNNAQTATPRLLKGTIIAPAGATPEIRVKEFFRANPSLFRIANPDAELRLQRKSIDAQGKSHIHFDQTYKGVPVFGRRLVSHIAKDGTITAINGEYLPDLNLSVIPTVTESEAIAIAQQHLGLAEAPASFDTPGLVISGADAATARLAWKFSLAADNPPTLMVYFIDALTGEIIQSYSNLQTAKFRTVYDWTINEDNTISENLLIQEGDPPSSDQGAQKTYDLSGLVYDYFADRFARDGWNCGDDDKNGIPGAPWCAAEKIKSVIRLQNPDYAGMWNGVHLSFTGSYGRNMGVVAHEYVHGITQRTADLIYHFQSGALNESFSEVFGIVLSRSIDFHYWAEDNLPLRETMSRYQWPPDNKDGGGNHVNDKIVTNAAMAVAADLGDEAMSAIWYKALTEYLTPTSQFIDAREALILAAEDLHGTNSAEAQSVAAAFDAVEITESSPPLIGNLSPRDNPLPSDIKELHAELLDVSGSGLDHSTLQVVFDSQSLTTCSLHVQEASSSTVVSCPLDGAALADGDHTFEVTIDDKNGNTQLASQTFRIGAADVIYIDQGATQEGADCPEVGTWDQNTLTCTLSGDIGIGTILEVAGDGITLSGGNSEPFATLGGAKPLAGITIRGKNNVTIKNMRLRNFAKGVLVDSSSAVTIDNVHFEANGIGIYLQDTTLSTIENNTFSVDGTGVFLNNANHNTVRDNTMSSTDTGYGVWTNNASSNVILCLNGN